MSQISAVAACIARVPLTVATSFSTRVVTERHYLLVRVTTQDGNSGIGFSYAGSRGGEVVLAAAEMLLAPVVVGEDSTRTEHLWSKMYSEALLQGRAGAVMRALSAIDIALHDCNARRCGLPLARHLGGYRSGTVPAYASGGYYLAGKTPDDLATEMAGYVAKGFRSVKMKVGRLGLREEEDRIRAVREAVGPDVRVMLDANNAWSDLETALSYMRIFEPYDPFWIEEPFGPDDITNHARLARATPVNVATGEIEVGRWRHFELLKENAATILQTDAAVCGGITEFCRIAGLAAGFGRNIWPHWFHDLHVHLVGALPNAVCVEYFPDAEVLNFRHLVDTQIEVVEGELKLPEAPGLGFDFDEEALGRFAGDGLRSSAAA